MSCDLSVFVWVFHLRSPASVVRPFLTILPVFHHVTWRYKHRTPLANMCYVMRVKIRRYRCFLFFFFCSNRFWVILLGDIHLLKWTTIVWQEASLEPHKWNFCCIIWHTIKTKDLIQEIQNPYECDMNSTVCESFSPHHCGVFVFLLASRLPPSVVRRRPPRASHLTPLISHNSSHTIHLTHNSSHTIHLTQFISHNSSHTQLISHNSSHTTHLTHNSSHTTHLTHHSSHTTHHTQLISHTTHLTHNSSQLISHSSSHTTHLTHLISQTCCLAGAVHRAFWRRCGADWRRSGRGYLLRGRRSTESLLKELRRGLAPQWPRLLVAWQAQ